jgi:Ca-activated chloride channel homolog
MSFLSPLAFAFAAAIPVVILFYLLKRKRTVKLVSSTLLWQKFLTDTQANAPFQKLRHNWLLLLQILLLLLAVLALSRPYFAGPEQNTRLIVVILDASASMQSTDVAPSRFEKARQEASRAVDNLRDADQMILLQAAALTEVKQSATSNKAALRRALQSCAVTDSPTRLTEALRLAETLVKDRLDAEVHLFSDGAAEDLSEFENKGLPLVYHRIGERARNVGIIALDLRANPDDPSQRAIYSSIANFSDTAQQVEIELAFDGETIELSQAEIGAGETLPQVFVTAQAQDGIFSIRIKVDDDLAADNQASVVSLLPQPVRVLLVTAGNPYLEKGLRVINHVELEVSPFYREGDFDLVVLDGVTPLEVPRENLLAIHVAHTNWFAGWSTVEAPPLVDWKAGHPLLRYVSFDNVFVRQSIHLSEPPSWAVSLVDAPQTPLILAGELDGQKIVWIGFDTLESSWPLRMSFPIFISNAVDWLNPAAARLSQLSLRTGDPFRLPLPQSITEGEIILPGGARRSIAIDPDASEFVWGDTSRHGVYQVRLGTNQFSFCVNLLDAAESNTRPAETLDLGRYVKVEASTVKRADTDLWRWIAGLALLVLLFEWWFYHRRTA